MGELDRVEGWHVANEDRFVSPNVGVGRQGLDDLLDTLDAKDPERVAEFGNRVVEGYFQKYGIGVISKGVPLVDHRADFLCREGGTYVLVMVYTVVDAGAVVDAPNDAMADGRLADYRETALEFAMGFEGDVDMRLDVFSVNVLTERRTAQVHHFIGVCSWEG